MIRERKQSVLITGGSGLTGRYLTSALLNAGYDVSHLSRGHDQFGKVRVHRWDPAKEILDPVIFNGIDHVIHLAGADLGEKRWTAGRKAEIISSRVDSARLIHKVIIENGIKIRSFISASGISFYGSVTSDKIFSESDPPADDFLASVCVKWEKAADLFASGGIRTVKLRTAPYLEENSIFLKRLTMTGPAGFLGMAGSGRQYIPWIHIEDLCNIYLKAISDESMNGVYNAVSPDHVTHRQFMKTLAQVKRKFLIPIPLPGIFLRAVYGEMADLALKGSRISSDKIRNSGFRFRYTNLPGALKNVYGND
jgi:uncharacterized protein